MVSKMTINYPPLILIMDQRTQNVFFHHVKNMNKIKSELAYHKCTFLSFVFNPNFSRSWKQN